MGIISDQMFTKNLQYLIDEKIISFPDERVSEIWTSIQQSPLLQF